MSCPQELVPVGWKVWRNADVPPALTQFAIHIRDHVTQYAYGSIAATTSYNGQTVGAFVSHHTWTFRKQPDGSMKLITGICIPGVSLVLPVAAGSQGIGATQRDSLDVPDATAAVYGGEPPPAKTNWGLVALSAGAGAAVVGLFWAALHFAGSPKRLTS